MNRPKNQAQGLEILADFAKPSNLLWLNDVIDENADQITKMYPGDNYDLLREEKEKKFLLDRLHHHIRAFIQIYLSTEVVTNPRLAAKFKPFLENNPDDFKSICLMMGFGTKEEIEKEMNFLKWELKKKRGRPKEIHKGRLTVILVKLFYYFGFKREHCFQKVAVIFTLLSNHELICKIPENLRKPISSFLSLLPPSPSSVRGLYKRYKGSVELPPNFPLSKTAIRFHTVIPDSAE